MQGTSASWAPQRTFATQMQGTSARWSPKHKMHLQGKRPHKGALGTSASWAPQHNARHVRKLGARTHVHNANGRHVRKLGAPTQCKARPQVGCPNATQGEFTRWAPKRKTHPQRKRPHKGELGKKTSWRMDKKKFWLGGRLFNMASPRLGTAMQRKARPQDMCPNTTHGMSVRWARKRKTDLQRKCPHKGALG
jgi:hypothetical protein